MSMRINDIRAGGTYLGRRGARRIVSGIGDRLVYRVGPVFTAVEVATFAAWADEMLPWIPSTTWQLDTVRGHYLTIFHRWYAQRSAEDAKAWIIAHPIQSVTLALRGNIEVRWAEGGCENILRQDLAINEFTRPETARSEPFIPDPNTEEGRARIRDTFTNPAYRLAATNYRLTDISLEDLAAIPGAVGRLGSLAHGLAQVAA